MALSHPAFLAAATVATAALLFSVSYRLFDFDLWEHLVVGKYLWTTGKIPTTQLWTWPTWGEPALIPSWLFRALLYPFWQLAGVPGLFAWRWITALATFTLLFVAARRMGAESFTTLVVLVLAALTYRQRTMVRPETLALLLFAAQIAILESRRAPGLGRGLALVLIAWAWINAHLSFVTGLAYLGFHVAAAWREGRAATARETPEGADARRRAAGLVRVGVAMLAVSFVNPFGARGVLQPFTFLFGGREEPIYATITELGAIDWSVQWKSGLPVLMLGWPVLLAWRARRRGLDLVEALACPMFTAQALLSQRFKAAYVVVAAPYVARALSEWLAARRLAPSALPAVPRAAAAAVLMVTIGIFEWSIPQFPPGISLDLRHYPVAACDFLESAGVRGRAFNDFWYGGYMEYRFWPDRERLPFMDGHLESGTEHDRTLYVRSQSDPAAWAQLDREKRFDFLLLSPSAPSGADLRARLEADTTWATVFIDDAAVVWVRRTGPLAGVARAHAYRHLRVSQGALEDLLARCASDAALREAAIAECRRQVDASPYHTVARRLLEVLEGLAAAGTADDPRANLRSP